MSVNCWQMLGIAPTADERAVKRAYAKLLKIARPEDDPQAFQALRTAFEEAMWQSDELLRQVPMPDSATSERPVREREVEQLLRPHIERLAELNERGTSEEAMAALEALLDEYQLRDATRRDPAIWQMLEDGMLWVCCDIAANHDDFLRAALALFGWGEPGNWLGEKDPKTVEWLRLRLREADALAAVDTLLDLLEDGGAVQAVAELERLAEDEMLVNVDVRHLFEAELMVGMAELVALPAEFSARVVSLFGWQRDHRHLEEYHPDAWQEFGKKMSAQGGVGRGI